MFNKKNAATTHTQIFLENKIIFKLDTKNLKKYKKDFKKWIYYFLSWTLSKILKYKNTQPKKC